MGRGADLRLDISTHNTEVVEGTMSVIEVSIPPRQAPHPGPLPA